ncbi:MAG: glutamate--tRNA ligase [Vicinamibacterales bacterium]
MIPRVRFAPSPTGYLHVGGARTALFNWLYARRHGGTFILRIEDTDLERSSAEMITGILDGLRWLGIDWDEGPGVEGPHTPYLQSQRLDRYRAAAARLVVEGHAYHCYCTGDRLRQERERAEQAGSAWKYDRACLALTPEQRAALDAANALRAVRFKVPEGVVGFDDQVHGPIEVDGATIEDFVILRSDQQPTYHLSVVVDDSEMGITHVVRGDDHISNTPKHLLLFHALGAEPPAFAHVPLILGQDKKRLSKRHGATSVTEYARAGYLPEAMVNFLALLGWSPGGDRELMTRAELVDAFDFTGISGGNAVFNTEKLDWMNGQYIARLPAARLVDMVSPLLHEAGLTPNPDPAWMARLMALLQPRAKRLTDFVEQARPFLVEQVEYEADAQTKHLQSPAAAAHVATLQAVLGAVQPFDEAAVEAAIRQAAADKGVKAGELIHLARVAMTGRTTSPGIFEVLVLLGHSRVRARLQHLGAYLTR